MSTGLGGEFFGNGGFGSKVFPHEALGYLTTVLVDDRGDDVGWNVVVDLDDELTKVSFDGLESVGF